MSTNPRTLGLSTLAAALLSALAAPAAAQTWQNETGLPLECDYCNLQFPPVLAADGGQTTQPVYGQLFEAGVTEPFGSAPAVVVQLGYGAAGSDPRNGGWQWFAAAFNAQIGNNDEYVATLTPQLMGSYSYTFRYSLDGGASFSAGDLDGAGANAGLDFSAAQLGTMTVLSGVPEPMTGLMLAAGLGLVGLRLRRGS